jgi:hypothetical protein
MTIFHTTHQPLTARTTAQVRRRAKAPAWIGRIAWLRIAALMINLALWAGIILGVRALLHS